MLDHLSCISPVYAVKCRRVLHLCRTLRMVSAESDTWDKLLNFTRNVLRLSVAAFETFLTSTFLVLDQLVFSAHSSETFRIDNKHCSLLTSMSSEALQFLGKIILYSLSMFEFCKQWTAVAIFTCLRIWATECACKLNEETFKTEVAFWMASVLFNSVDLH